MAEAGVDISTQKSKLVQELPDLDFDYVITVCDNARNSCPVFPAASRIVHVGFDDPPHLAASCRGDEEKTACYRRVRNEIRSFVENLPDNLAKLSL